MAYHFIITRTQNMVQKSVTENDYISNISNKAD